MHRPALAAIVVALALSSIPSMPAPTAAAGSCRTYTSETAPPPTIRVFRAATGAVETVDFRAYVKNVLSREWISSWTTESLRAGALAVKNYAWYQVLHWRGHLNGAGQCFHLFDSTRDQVYDPARPTYATAAAAVDATWSTLALKGGRIFATYYNAGAAGEACGANANGWKMYQWGSQACGLAGRTASQIMATYYAGVVVTGTPPPASPRPTPSPTPRPTPTPGAPAPSAPARSPTASPTPTPTPAATPTPPPPPAAPPSDEQPGGGQVGIAAPPPPPPALPEPIVVAPAASIAQVAVAQELPAPRVATDALNEIEERLSQVSRHAPRPQVELSPRAVARLALLRFAFDRLVAVFVPEQAPDPLPVALHRGASSPL